jgi:hypothetical protein
LPFISVGSQISLRAVITRYARPLIIYTLLPDNATSKSSNSTGKDTRLPEMRGLTKTFYRDFGIQFKARRRWISEQSTTGIGTIVPRMCYNHEAIE